MLRLSIRFAQLGGMAGTAVLLSQGEWVKAIQCATVTGACIVILHLASRMTRPRGGKPRG